MRQAFFFAAAFVVCVASADEPTAKPITILFKNVWAWQMPGTMDVRELEPKIFGEEAKKLPDEDRKVLDQKSLVNQILRRLKRFDDKDKVGPGFAVAGTGSDALREAHAVLVLGKKPQEVFTTENEVTLVFFTSLSIQYVQLREVQLFPNNTAEVRFVFVPHDSLEVMEHFALISLGKLRQGKFDVKMVQLPMEEKYVKAGFTAITTEQGAPFVCKPFSFDVKEKDK